MGTPEFACPSLQALIEADDIEVIALVTQPDRAVGRKQIITPPATKVLANKRKLPVLQAERISKDEAVIEQIIELKPDFLITVAYGQILKQNILDIAPVINLHASLLPEFRGPAPINWMLFHGDTEVGLATMLTDAGVDTGDILLTSKMEIDNKIKADELTKKLSDLGAPLLVKTILEFEEIKAQPQTSCKPDRQLAPFMDKNLGQIDFAAEALVLKSASPRQSDFEFRQKNSAKAIHNLVRGSYPWPGAWFERNGEKIIVLETQANKLETNEEKTSVPSTISQINRDNGSFSIICHEGELEILQVKAQGKSAMRALDWLNGQRLKPGEKLCSS